MEVIFQLARRLALVAIFAGFSELLLPSGKFRSFTRFAVGLVIITLMLQPLAMLRGLRFDPEKLLGSEEAGGGIGGRGWVQAQTQDIVEAELAGKIVEYLAPEYPDCKVNVDLDVSFDEYGLLKEFRGMEVELSPAARGIKPVAPVVIGGSDRTPAQNTGRPGLTRELAEYLGVPVSKLTLRVFSNGGSGDE